MRLDTIVAYTFNADTYCPDCIVKVLPYGEGEAFDGWKLSDGWEHLMTTEENLDEIAAAFGIDRQDERSFDSGDFPKVVFYDDGEPEYCGRCHEPILED
jgi:hypothetical protein